MPSAFLKENVAEWILRLVTTQERASATVGDLLEMSSGVVRFWASVLSTATSIAWREAWAHPRQTTWLAVRGTLYSFLWVLAGLFVAFVALFVIGYFAGLSPAKFDQLGANWPGKTLAFLFGNVWMPFLLGRWIARKAPGREMSVCLATMILQTVLGTCISALVAQLNHTLDFKPLLAELSLSIVGVFPYFAFTALAMHRRRHAYA
jgi:hypothetical protein